MRRGAVYACGVVVGLVPLLSYNLWAFGSALHLSYVDAIAVPGKSGHDVLGLNSPGFFGVGRPHPRVALELLFSNRGLLTLTPVLALAGIGVVLLFRRGWRAEALTIAGDRARLPRVRLRLCQPIRRRRSRAPIPHPCDPVPRCCSRAVLPQAPGPDTRSRCRVGCADGGRDRCAAASSERRHRPLVAAAHLRGSLAHGAHLARLRPRLGLALALSARRRRCGRDCRVEHDLAVVPLRRRRDGLAALACWLVLADVAPIAVVPGHPVALGGVPLLLVAAGIAAAAVVSVALVSTGSRA